VVIVSDALPTVKGSAFDVDPPGFTTVTVAVPAEAIELAGTDAVSWVVLTNVVVRADPFHCTVDPTRKPDPLTVSVKAGPPAAAELGERLEREGVGAAAVTVKATGLLLPA